MKTIQPRKQRKMLFNAPLHKRRKRISAHLEENLLLKYDKRSIPLIKGDSVTVMRGSFKGHKDKITRVDVKKGFVEIEGLTLTKADGKKIAKPIHPSNLLITKLNLTDKWRRRKIESGLSEEAKKEIEKEAEIQIRELEEQKKKEELEKEKLTQEEIEPSMEEETIEKLPEIKEKKTEKKEPEPKKKVAKPKEQQSEKKSSEKKKTPPKKKVTKKSPAKTTKKKTEEK